MRKQIKSRLDPHAETLAIWFTPRDQGGEGLTLHEAAARLAKEHSLKVSASRLSQWWQQQLQQAMQAKVLSGIATGARLNRDIEAQFAKHPAPEFDSLLRLFKTITLQLAVNGQTDPDLLKLAESFGRLILEERKASSSAKLKEQELALETRRVNMLEQKAAQADKARDVMEAKLSPEEQQQRLRQIFGLS